MEWIQQHAVEILAVLGALYAAARGIVALTPTPKDDEVLTKIQTFAAALAKALGLTINQGLGATKNTVKKTTTVGIVMMVMLYSGCAWPSNPRGDLLASQKVFAATVRTLAQASRAGQIGDDEFVIIDGLITEAHGVLKNWQANVEAGIEDPGPIMTFNQLLGNLAEWAAKYGDDNGG